MKKMFKIRINVCQRVLDDIVRTKDLVKNYTNSGGGFFRSLYPDHKQLVSIEGERFTLYIDHDIQHLYFRGIYNGNFIGAGQAYDLDPYKGYCNIRMYRAARSDVLERIQSLGLGKTWQDMLKIEEEICRLIRTYLDAIAYENFVTWVSEVKYVYVRPIGQQEDAALEREAEEVAVDQPEDPDELDTVHKIRELKDSSKVVYRQEGYRYKGYPECITHKKDSWVSRSYRKTITLKDGTKKDVYVKGGIRRAHDKDRPDGFVKKKRRQLKKKGDEDK